MDFNYERVSEVLKSPSAAYRYWMHAIELSKPFEDWERQAKDAYEMYEGGQEQPFNILFSNTQTILPAVYNSEPVPDVRPRFNDNNDIARKGAQVIERALVYGADEYPMGDEIYQAVRDAVVISRGQVRVKYDPVLRTVQDETTGLPAEELVFEHAMCEYVPWKHYREGKAWRAFAKFLTRDELDRLNPEISSKVELDASDRTFKNETPEAEKSPFKKVKVWEIWDKVTRQVWYVSEGYTDGPIAVVEDPLNLLDFFPCPKALYWYKKHDGGVPICPIQMYSRQAEELNVCTRRILDLVAQVQWKGIYAAEIAEFQTLFDQNNGEWQPSQGADGFDDLSKKLYAMPLDTLTIALRELLLQREQIKKTIYEITGISDILRGSSQASETLGAQQIKAQWASYRIVGLQKEIQRFCRDIFRLKTEIIANKFSPETLSYIYGEQVTPEIMETLRKDMQRVYAIEVQTDSTIRADKQRVMEQMNQFLSGTGLFMQSMAPLIQMKGREVEPILLGIYKSFASNFELGKDVENMLSEALTNLMQQPQDPEDEKQKQIQQAQQDMGLQKQQIDLEKDQQELIGQQIENRNAQMGIPSGPGIVS